MNKYALSKDVQASSRRPTPPGSEFVTPPLLVLNNFGGEERQIKLMVATFQNLFPPIQVQSMKLSQARRIVLLNYNSASGTIDWRHYLISVRLSAYRNRFDASSKAHVREAPAEGYPTYPQRKTSQTTSLAEPPLPASMAKFETDASEAESEAEDVADRATRFTSTTGTSAAVTTPTRKRLSDCARSSRMELKLVKIEEGCNEGAVLFHEYVKKSVQQQTQLHREHVERKRLQEERRAEQEEKRGAEEGG